MAAYITVGAKTTHGGTVISGSPHTTHNGIPVARKGDKVMCKKCKKVVTIATGDPSFVIDGAPIARAGDVTTCGSKLIAIQQSFAQSDFEVGGIEPPEEYIATYGDVDQGSDSDDVEDEFLNQYVVQIMINDNNTLTGTHAGLILNSPNDQIIWDPSGSFHYPNYGEGSSRMFYADDASLARDMWREYIRYQYIQDGPNVRWYTFKITEKNYKKIYEKINNGCGGIANCSICVSQVLSGIGPFRNLKSGIRFPSNLRKAIEPIYYQSR